MKRHFDSSPPSSSSLSNSQISLDEFGPTPKRHRIFISSPILPLNNDTHIEADDAEEEIIIDDPIASPVTFNLASENEHNSDDDIIEIEQESFNIFVDQNDNQVIIVSNSDDDQRSDVTHDIPSSVSSIINMSIASFDIEDVEIVEGEVNVELSLAHEEEYEQQVTNDDCPESLEILTDVDDNISDNELIDLTEDEFISISCSPNSCERKLSIDVQQCPICLETLNHLQRTGVYLIITRCRHVMCTLCTRQLLATSSRCPLCRENMALAAIQALYDDDDDDGKHDEKTIAEEEINDRMAVINDPTFSVMSKIKLNLTPAIAVRPEDTSSFLDIRTREVQYNPKYEDMYAPVFGPSNPNLTQQQSSHRNTINGHVESTTLSDFQFENQRRTFDSFGYAADPSVGEHPTQQIIGDQVSAEINQGKTIFETSRKLLNEKRKKEKNNDSSDVDRYQGPWAPYVDEITVSRPSEEEQKEIDEHLAKRKKIKRRNLEDQHAPISARDPESTTLNKEAEDPSSSTLHIKDPYDYQGRSYLHIPQDVGVNLRSDHGPQRCFIPKQCIHIYKGHTKAVQKIHYFPVSAHLFLTCSMDCKVKLWEFYNERRCIRTFSGHSQAVRDVSFNNAGTEFLSASYDKTVKLWDTETGQVKSKFPMRKIPYCISFNPSEHKQHLFICGMSDKKILCFDIRSGHVVQEYDRHLGAINTVTFVDRNRRIVSTSDDKSIRVWEWNIPVDFKYIADPTMHSMPAVAQSRNGKYLAFQSMDNQIRIMEPLANFRWKSKKIFKGHMVSGYACGLDFSPDMSYLISGDADGRLIIWDWKTTRIFEQIKAHDDVCIDAKWHWHEKSRVLTAGWDNVVKLWD
ncbi:unnamed protein product [Rotaria socialis]|uniref:Pre-mRNA-processing factor 17 n=2 Tax=Rotaria socialis TaxID=392032 RepID=A0A819ZFD9_9BILA|nr:unnamed protein product [Rotaria socialis]CAF3358305.1 unnamed protein product [Rotaria socialis]CAF4105778.1 unnamed protein product [Rotaria socialis]CAF4167763.1 unnamed protein product [Rotaria socialis]